MVSSSENALEPHGILGLLRASKGQAASSSRPGKEGMHTLSSHVCTHEKNHTARLRLLRPHPECQASLPTMRFSIPLASYRGSGQPCQAYLVTQKFLESP